VTTHLPVVGALPRTLEARRTASARECVINTLGACGTALAGTPDTSALLPLGQDLGGWGCGGGGLGGGGLGGGATSGLQALQGKRGRGGTTQSVLLYWTHCCHLDRTLVVGGVEVGGLEAGG
jgi:hypothetical protein